MAFNPQLEGGYEVSPVLTHVADSEGCFKWEERVNHGLRRMQQIYSKQPNMRLRGVTLACAQHLAANGSRNGGLAEGASAGAFRCLKYRSGLLVA